MEEEEEEEGARGKVCWRNQRWGKWMEGVGALMARRHSWLQTPKDRETETARDRQ